MNRSLLWRFLLVVFVVAGCITFAWPPKNRPLIEVFKEKLERNDTNITAILAQFEKLQAAAPQNEFKNLKDAVGDVPLTNYFDFDLNSARNRDAVRDPNTAILNWIQRSAAGKIRLGLDLQGGSSFLVEMQLGKLATNTTKSVALNNAIEVLRKRVDRFGVAEPLIQPVGEDRILVQMPGLSEAAAEGVRTALQKAAFLEFRWVHDESPQLLSQGIIPPGYQRMRTARQNQRGETEVSEYIVERKPIPGLNGKNVRSATEARSTLGAPEVEFTLDSDGATAFARVTAPENRNRFMAIILDGELYSAPRINEQIAGGQGRIMGQFTEKEAEELAAILQNPLEAPLKVLSEERVDPSLGKDTIASGKNATIYGMIGVAVFMMVYYFFGGLVANFALALNVIITIGIMCAFNSTWTMPGIAGMLLSVGMAVDANVLIFERIREELAKGKTLRGALAAGYSRAFGTILDSHVTTLITSIILGTLGTGAIKGFGITLTIGVAASLFTAVVVTRLVFDFLLARNWLKSLPMMNLVQVEKVNFVRWGKMALICTFAIAFIGIGYGIVRGKEMVGYEFLGGDNLTLEFTKKVDVDKIRDVIKPITGEALIQYQRELTGTGERLRITAGYNSAEAVMTALSQKLPEAGFRQVGSERVGPVVGEEILRSAVISLLLAVVGILFYVSLRYQISFAVAAIVATLHDVLLTVGIYALVGRELNATMIAGLLTIIGYSINDKIVILDRIREDLELGVRGSFTEVVNIALNQTLGRTLITGGSVLLATLSLLIFGGGAINDFAFTFLIGVLAGTYSSIYIATTIVLWWHKGQRPANTSQVVMDGGMAAGKAPKPVKA